MEGIAKMVNKVTKVVKKHKNFRKHNVVCIDLLNKCAKKITNEKSMFEIFS